MYNLHWLNGPDAELFVASNVDDDSDPSNGYKYLLATARTLPAGEYRVSYHLQHYGDFPCNFKPDETPLQWTVNVIAPSGTMHEAFFDPVLMVGGALGADGSSEVLDASDFSVGGVETDISRLVWESQKVKMELTKSVALASKHIDFIELDGNVGLRLDFDDAVETTPSGGGSLLTWNVCDQPWFAGDLLMIRISESASGLVGATNDASCDGTVTSIPIPEATVAPMPTMSS